MIYRGEKFNPLVVDCSLNLVNYNGHLINHGPMHKYLPSSVQVWFFSLDNIHTGSCFSTVGLRMWPMTPSSMQLWNGGEKGKHTWWVFYNAGRYYSLNA